VPLNAPIISKCPDIRIQELIFMTGCLPGSASRNHTCRLHVPPSVIQEHRKELAGYATTKAIVSFPKGKPVPMTLVKKLVRANLKAMKDKSK
jgi:uncharacterized protein YdhG (YjbR/CyaY superfamily)